MRKIAIFTATMISTTFCVALEQPRATAQQVPANFVENELNRRAEVIKTLKAGTYLSGKSRITLKDGLRVHPRIQKGEDAGETTLLVETIAIANPPIDDGPDAVVLLGVSHGGNEVTIELHAVRLRDGKVQDLAMAQLGTNVAVNGISIDGDIIHVQTLVHGEGDPRCCPSQREDSSYRLKGNSLTRITTEINKVDELLRSKKLENAAMEVRANLAREKEFKRSIFMKLSKEVRSLSELIVELRVNTFPQISVNRKKRDALEVARKKVDEFLADIRGNGYLKDPEFIDHVDKEISGLEWQLNYYDIQKSFYSRPRREQEELLVVLERLDRWQLILNRTRKYKIHGYSIPTHVKKEFSY